MLRRPASYHFLEGVVVKMLDVCRQRYFELAQEIAHTVVFFLMGPAPVEKHALVIQEREPQLHQLVALSEKNLNHWSHPGTSQSFV